jgi:hypothetical protein
LVVCSPFPAGDFPAPVDFLSGVTQSFFEGVFSISLLGAKSSFLFIMSSLETSRATRKEYPLFSFWVNQKIGIHFARFKTNIANISAILVPVILH